MNLDTEETYVTSRLALLLIIVYNVVMLRGNLTLRNCREIELLIKSYYADIVKLKSPFL